ncbi:putative ATPase [Dongia mobilis]|uniref:Putative ATPase n=1 Tax=Dongia mobilis TaxID=578943 RepID=A0A4V3DEX0_9PROT|nr:adenylate/guanylate cyclase domain-containing protein [Dongia mobilis]TDQ83440.1 putative ATPase [Dongia mobilis]
MRCGACNAENREDRRFCAACGAPLPFPCPACGFANDPGDGFCGGCGRGLLGAGAAHEMPAERRPVSILFADLAGYSALAQRADPEDVHALLARFFAVADDIVLRFGGRIDKHMGDNVMALFGAPVAHGDDPRRAVGAALAIHAAMPALAAETGHDLKVHIGIAVGDVLASGLGSAAHSSYTVIGNAVNLAARLMELAPPGETRVSAEIAAAVAGHCQVTPLGRQAVKGIGAEVEIFRVAEAAPVEGQDARDIVGRRAEIAQIAGLLAACRQAMTGLCLLIRGVPGIGKSRLLEEALRQAGVLGYRPALVRILDFGAGRERDPMCQLARALLDLVLLDLAPAASALTPLQLALIRDLADRPLAAEEQQLVAAMDHAARAGLRVEALAALLAGLAAPVPLLLAVEDIHWADAGVLDLLAVLTERVAGLPVVIVLTSRLDPDPIDAAWRARLHDGRIVTIDLAPMTEAEALEMSRQIAADLDAFARQCVVRAEGNPLFLEQLLRSRLTGEADDLPASLRNVVLARLDQLPESERLALQAASVLGQHFDAADLALLLERPAFDPAPMLRRQLLRPVAGGYLFAHALVHHGIYSTLTRERRRALHNRAAGLFAERDPVLHAEHLDRAEAAGAALAYARAAENEAARYHLDLAKRLAARGLELAQDDAELVRLGLVAGRCHLDIGEALPAQAAFGRALAAAMAPLDRCLALIGLAASDRQLGNLEAALANLAMAEPVARQADDASLLAEISYLRGNLHFAVGAADSCLQAHEMALAAARRAGATEWLARAESGLGDANYMLGRYAEAEGHFSASVATAEAAGHLRIICVNRCMIGNCHVFACRFDEALQHVALAQEAAARIGDRFGEMFGLECRAFILMAAHRWAEAAAPAEAAMQRAAAIGARRFESITAAILARARLEAGERDAALALSARALELAEATGIGFAGAIIESIRAGILGPGADGRAAVDRGERLLLATSMAHNHIFFRTFAIDWAIAAGDWPLVGQHAESLAAFTASRPSAYTDIVIERARLFSRFGRDATAAAAREALAALAVRTGELGFALRFPA